MKNELQVIADLIEKDKKVLDVGCADATLMKFLKVFVFFFIRFTH